MQSFEYKLNSFKEKKIGNKYIFISFSGKWVSLSKNEYLMFKRGILNDNLFHKLEENHIIVTSENKQKIVDFYRGKKPQLFQGTSLHIIIVTLRCNETCIYCHAASKPTKNNGIDINLKTAKKTVDFIFQTTSSAITIEFQGGEPLLNFKIIKEIVHYAKEKNKKAKKQLNFSIVSNLSLMNEEILNFFLEQKVFGICTSIDGPKELHDTNRPMIGDSSYDLAIPWIKKIKNENIDLNGIMSTTRQSLSKVKKIVDEYRKLKFRRIWFRPLNNLGAATNSWEKLNYSASEYLKFWIEGVNYVYSFNDITENSSLIILRKILGDRDPMYLDLMSPCGAGIGQMAYNYDGNIFSCDEARMLNDDLFKLGNVFENNYTDIMTSDKIKNLISASINDSFECNKCSYQAYCGLCPACTYSDRSTLVPLLTNDFRCQVLKGQFEFIFKKILSDDNFVSKISHYLIPKRNIY